LAARIIAVCDAFSAMTSSRPYRATATRQHALDELRRCAGAQFDPDVVAAFCAEIERVSAEAHTGAEADPASQTGTGPSRSLTKPRLDGTRRAQPHDVPALELAGPLAPAPVVGADRVPEEPVPGDEEAPPGLEVARAPELDPIVDPARRTPPH